MGVALLDTSAVIAYLYGDDGLHPGATIAIEEAVAEGTTLAISAITWAELLNGPDQEVVRDFVRDVGITILPVDGRVAERAAALQAGYAKRGRRHDRPRLRLPDALILATANAYDIDVVIGGDAQWPKVPGVAATVMLLR
ncbi:MAG: PilT protein domain protein [Conexibacter sp.]|nr:PilT protein domain protein [Conexibacter sp.]